MIVLDNHPKLFVTIKGWTKDDFYKNELDFEDTNEINLSEHFYSEEGKMTVNSINLSEESTVNTLLAGNFTRLYSFPNLTDFTVFVISYLT
jgi:hypothetical protein